MNCQKKILGESQEKSLKELLDKSQEEFQKKYIEKFLLKHGWNPSIICREISAEFLAKFHQEFVNKPQLEFVHECRIQRGIRGKNNKILENYFSRKPLEDTKDFFLTFLLTCILTYELILHLSGVLS